MREEHSYPHVCQMTGAISNTMKTIFIQCRRYLMQMVINLMLLIIVVSISSAIFADTSYYKALFFDYLKNSGFHRNRVPF
jgi:hypothetical protein